MAAMVLHKATQENWHTRRYVYRFDTECQFQVICHSSRYVYHARGRYFRLRLMLSLSLSDIMVKRRQPYLSDRNKALRALLLDGRVTATILKLRHRSVGF